MNFLGIDLALELLNETEITPGYKVHIELAEFK